MTGGIVVYNRHDISFVLKDAFFAVFKDEGLSMSFKEYIFPLSFTRRGRHGEAADADALRKWKSFRQMGGGWIWN